MVPEFDIASIRSDALEALVRVELAIGTNDRLKLTQEKRLDQGGSLSGAGTLTADWKRRNNPRRAGWPAGARIEALRGLMPSTRIAATIERLSEMPDAVPTVARWILGAWGAKTYAQTVASLEKPGVPAPLIAVVAGEPAGVVSFAHFDLGKTGTEDLWIDALFVEPTRRSVGLGSRLISEAIAVAASQVQWLYVYTDIGPWYEQRGWQIVEAKKGGTVLRFECGAHDTTPIANEQNSTA